MNKNAIGIDISGNKHFFEIKTTSSIYVEQLIIEIIF